MSTCMRGRGWGEYNIRLLLRSKQQLPFRKTKKRGSLQKFLRRELFRWEKCRPPGRTMGGGQAERERGPGGCFISSSLGNVSRLTAQRPGVPEALYSMRRPTARVAWTVWPMRTPQRDREAESPASSSLGMMGVRKPVVLQQGSFCFLKQPILSVLHFAFPL